MVVSNNTGVDVVYSIQLKDLYIKLSYFIVDCILNRLPLDSLNLASQTLLLIELVVSTYHQV